MVASEPLPASSLSFYTDWSFCDGCGLPPRIVQDKKQFSEKDDLKQQQQRTKKLSICRVCKTVAYHDSQCQKIHWTEGGHRNVCKKLSVAVRPLQDIMSAYNYDHSGKKNHRCSFWWCESKQDIARCEEIWNINVLRWNDKDYLKAMGGFQQALEHWMKIWDSSDRSSLSLERPSSLKNAEHQFQFGIKLSRRLLFCAYCESDAHQNRSSRSRLALCISILLNLLNYNFSTSFLLPLSTDDEREHRIEEQEKQNNKQERERNQYTYIITPILNDAWMELMLSYEEEPELRKISYHVVHMAIQCGKEHCQWNDPLQRPGYMTKLGVDDSAGSLSLPYILPEQHPAWCRVLENNWKDIEKEMYNLLPEADHIDQSSMWGQVGSGDRGSGFDDHRVVSSGSWKEYVLFGQGEGHTDNDAPITKRLLKMHVSDAVLLAQSGGGEIIFSRLAPQTRIDAHCGPTNLRLTAHLPLLVPNKNEDCKIRIKKKWYHWKIGKILLFDDSYEHEIRNDTDQVRIVLLIRFFHPLLSCEQRQSKLMEARRQKELAVEKRYIPPV